MKRKAALLTLRDIKETVQLIVINKSDKTLKDQMVKRSYKKIQTVPAVSIVANLFMYSGRHRRSNYSDQIRNYHLYGNHVGTY